MYSGFKGAQVIPSNKAATQITEYSKQFSLMTDITSFGFKFLLLNQRARHIALLRINLADNSSPVSAST